MAYPDLGKMTRDIMAVPASRCAVECQFSISGRIAIWQRSRLSARTISNAIVYRATVARTGDPIKNVDIFDNMDDLLIDERIGKVPHEWMQGWWLEKLEKIGAAPEIVELFGGAGNQAEAEDLYG